MHTALPARVIASRWRRCGVLVIAVARHNRDISAKSCSLVRLVNTSNFNWDQFDRVKLLFDIANSNDVTVPTFNRWNERTDAAGIAELRRRAHEATRRDPAALEFFSSSKHDGEPVVSNFGSKLTSGNFRVNGRHCWPGYSVKDI